LRFKVQGSFKDKGSGFRVQGSGFKDEGLRFRVEGLGFRVQGSGFTVEGKRGHMLSINDLWFMVFFLGYRVTEPSGRDRERVCERER
jgi:hypothetical protein